MDAIELINEIKKKIEIAKPFMGDPPEWLYTLITTIESQKEEIESLVGWHNREVNRMSSEIKSFKAITELAVKGLKDIQYTENIFAANKMAEDLVAEIEKRLSK